MSNLTHKSENIVSLEREKAALKATNISFCYKTRKQTESIFQDIHLSVKPREIVALLGGSGCGKSTLLRVLSGLSKPTAGEVTFLGQPLTKPHPRGALVFQQASLLPWLDVKSNIAFGLNFKEQPKLDAATRESRVQEALEAVGLKGKEKLFPNQLSGGMAQRVALARALAREPELLFADEPFSALDAITRTEMQTLLVDVVHRWRTAVLLVTHDIDEAILVADRVLLMGGRPGRIVREWKIDLPHPRNTQPEILTQLHFDILSALCELRQDQSH